MINAFAVAYSEMAAGVPFYGRQATIEDSPKTQTPLMFPFGELDELVNATWPEVEAALSANHKTFEAYFYPAANHGFHRDTAPRNSEEMTKLAWERTIG